MPVVGYLAYDHVAKLEPTVPLPADGPACPESRFVVADTLVRFDHGSGTAEVLAGDADAIARRLDSDFVLQQHKLARRSARPCGAPPSRPSTRRRAADQGATSAPGDAFQIVLSQRAERPTSASALELYRALRRVNPSPYLFLLELGDLALIGSSPETLVKCEDGRASLNPIAGTTHPGEGDAERLLASEKDRAEHVMLVDLGRNDLSRVCAPGTVARRALPRAGALLARHAPRLGGRRRAADGRDAVRPPARLLPRRHGLGRAEGARDADHLRARGLPPRPVRRRGRLRRSRAARSTRASRSARSCSTTASRGSRRARGSWQTRIRRPSTGSA